MPPRDDDLKITNHSLGKPIAGKLLWLSGYETTGAIELETGMPVVAIKIFPIAGDADFTEPIVIMLAVQDIETFFRAIRIAEAGLHPSVRDGGTA
jgi:hypothetical protein